jgi:hypothetical protein
MIPQEGARRHSCIQGYPKTHHTAHSTRSRTLAHASGGRTAVAADVDGGRSMESTASSSASCAISNGSIFSRTSSNRDVGARGPVMASSLDAFGESQSNPWRQRVRGQMDSRRSGRCQEHSCHGLHLWECGAVATKSEEAVDGAVLSVALLLDPAISICTEQLKDGDK